MLRQAGICCLLPLIVAGTLGAAEPASIRGHVTVVVVGEEGITEASFGDYRLHIERDIGLGSSTAKVRLLHQSRQVFVAEEGVIAHLHFWKGNELVTKDDALCCEGKHATPYTVFDGTVEIARDITGDGVPELLLSEDPSNAGSLMPAWTVFSLAPLDRVTGQLGGDAQGGKWRYIPGQRLPVFDTMEDWSFWSGIKTCFSMGPCPRITLRYRDGAFRIAEDVMRKAKPSESYLAGMSREMAVGVQDDCRGEALADQMLELIFSGNASSAFRLYDLGWPGDSKAKQEFRSAFIKRLEESASCRDLVRDGLLGGEPVKCK